MVLKKRYEEAGVSLEEASKTVSRIKSVVKSTFNERVLIDVGAFAALYDASFPNSRIPFWLRQQTASEPKSFFTSKEGLTRKRDRIWLQCVQTTSSL